MKNYIIYIVLVIFFAMTCGGCGSSSSADSGESFSNGDGEYFGKVMCRHKAITTAIIAAEKGYSTKMVCWTINENGFSHIQTAVKIDDIWKYLCIGDDNIVFICKPDYDNPSEERDAYRYSDVKVEYIGTINDLNEE